MSAPRNLTDGVWLILPEHTALEFNAFTPTATPPTLQELQGMVGGYIERVELRELGDAYINEEGKLQGQPYNDVATRLCHLYAAIATNDVIVGPFVLTIGKAVPD
jgi:hypothetical protein